MTFTLNTYLAEQWLGGHKENLPKLDRDRVERFTPRNPDEQDFARLLLDVAQWKKVDAIKSSRGAEIHYHSTPNKILRSGAMYQFFISLPVRSTDGARSVMELSRFGSGGSVSELGAPRRLGIPAALTFLKKAVTEANAALDVLHAHEVAVAIHGNEG